MSEVSKVEVIRYSPEPPPKPHTIKVRSVYEASPQSLLAKESHDRSVLFEIPQEGTPNRLAVSSVALSRVDARAFAQALLEMTA